MPNKAAKQRKQRRAMLNKKWAKEGRTAKQHKKWLKNGGGQVINKYGRQIVFGIEYVLVFVVAFSTGYDLGKDKKCKHKHIIVKHKPWYTLNVKHCLHKHNCKHKRKWKRHKHLHWRW